MRLGEAKNQGFTLVEMMTALVVGTILLSLGIPSLMKWVDRMQVLAETTELLESFALARQYAINAKTHVTVCGSLNGSECDGGWEKGFLVFVHGGAENEFINRTATPLLYHYQTGDTFTTHGNISRFTFRPSGLLKGRSGSILFCPKASEVTDFRRIVVSRGGRIRSYTPEQVARLGYLSEMSCLI